MKKFISAILIFASLICVLGSCGEAINDKENSVTVNEEQWKKAFSSESFENVSITFYWDDSSKEKPRNAMIDGTKVFSNGYGGGSNSDGISVSYVFDNWFYLKDGKFYLREKSVATYSPSGEIKTEWSDDEYREKITPDTFADLVATMQHAFQSKETNLKDLYGKFTFDSDEKAYKGVITEQVDDNGESETYKFNITVAFSGGKATSIKFTREDGEEISETRALYIYDYGTTKIVIPDMPKE